MVKLEAKRENLSTHIQFLIPISIKKIFRLKHFSFFFGGIKVVIILIEVNLFSKVDSSSTNIFWFPFSNPIFLGFPNWT